MRHREKSRERKTRTEQRRSLLKEARLEGVEAKRVEASLPIYNASPWTQQWSLECLRNTGCDNCPAQQSLDHTLDYGTNLIHHRPRIATGLGGILVRH